MIELVVFLKNRYKDLKPTIQFFGSEWLRIFSTRACCFFLLHSTSLAAIQNLSLGTKCSLATYSGLKLKRAMISLQFLVLLYSDHNNRCVARVEFNLHLISVM